MKDLFKKKPAAPKQAKPKKPLFGKKAIKTSEIDQFSDRTTTQTLDGFSQQPFQEQVPAKKSGLFAKKPAKVKPASGSVVSDAKASQKPKSLQMDTKKLIPLLGLLLLLVLGGLAAKMFLFNEEPVSEPVTPVVSEPVPATEEPVVAETETQVAQPTDVSIPADSVQTATPNTAPAVSESVTPENQAVAPANTPVAPQSNQPISYDDFVNESSKKVYRERTTDPASLPPTQQ